MSDPSFESQEDTQHAALGGEFAWPTPDLASYPSAEVASEPLACQIEGINGNLLDGELLEFDPAQGLLQLRMARQRKPLALRLEQFRRLRLAQPLQPTPVEEREFSSQFARDLGEARPLLPFHIVFKGGAVWDGVTIGCHDEPWGLFLFEPADDEGTLTRWFVPRAACDSASAGLRLGEALLNEATLTQAELQGALAEQQAMRERRLGDMLVVRQIISAEELAAAIEHQSRMPMVRIGEALSAMGFITEAQLEDALAQQRGDRGVPLGELLVRQGLVSRANLQTALARKMGYPLVDVLAFPPDTDAVARLPYAVASRAPALPLMVRNNRLVVAVEDPSNRSMMDELEFAAQCKVVPVLARAGVLLGAVDRAYEKIGALTTGGGPRFGSDGSITADFEPGDASKLLASMERVEARIDEDEDHAIEQSDNSLVRLINSMILEGYTQGVSDIHVECPGGREKVRIRFRKDGRLRPYLELPHTYRSAIIGRLKVMCDLDISERRKPQDGKINFSKFVAGVRLELRVATVPTHNNLEDAVLRLLQSSRPLALGDLGLSPRNLEQFRALSRRPYGMLLCVGPTGSGKTTTLHSVLADINTPERKIWTAEDPVEITQAGLRQVQVNARIDWTFAKALRAFLRADPDVIMVGEIRDKETAQVAIEASLTGHLLLSTLHTNSAPETVTRLLDMGMDPFNFADALLGVLAQRLVRRLCPSCRVAHDCSAEEETELLDDHLHVMAETEQSPSADAVRADWRRRYGRDGRLLAWHSAGCDACGHSGFRGRAGIHELMTVSRSLRHLIQTGSRSDDLQRHAIGEGMRTLRQDGIEKVLAGITTIEEVRANS
ncbi:Type II secretory pathway, ATPase PulE/Tfp pilus assembly pathway, ATPase PilB [Rubrivivax sp. A210]|uniref:GspE/PulE family protein n=1 Tax=Rubrivivax sp. A210 TaxID=2772301 RepID=UPI00199FAC45|nr:GspE/PulE family protein [Rubrivivax sp. A210]CAD5372497.1 Type II secretory pathway, ATPase PulE/Tfp pilus assembly pathway, ATPase PilB [Rubrivivax sp. A210]